MSTEQPRLYQHFVFRVNQPFVCTKEDFERLEIVFRGHPVTTPSKQSQIEKSPKEDSRKEIFKCDKCIKSFSSESIRTKHIKKVHEKPPRFRCEICEHKSHYKKEHNKHMKAHEDHAFVCGQCGARKSNKFRLDQHVDQMHPSNHPTYNKCNKLFLTKPELRMHKKSCGNDGQVAPKQRKPKLIQNPSHLQPLASHLGSGFQLSKGSTFQTPGGPEGSTSQTPEG